jgi:predicted RNase H-like nuclease (RuvC/YqgF family)
MKEVNLVLRKKGLSVSDLPSDYQTEVRKLKAFHEKYDDACDKYEEEEEVDEEEEKELDAMEEVIMKRDVELAEAIDKLDIKAKPNNNNGEPKKKGSGGLLLLGAVVLVVTLGSVNLFKK